MPYNYGQFQSTQPLSTYASFFAQILLSGTELLQYKGHLICRNVQSRPDYVYSIICWSRFSEYRGTNYYSNVSTLLISFFFTGAIAFQCQFGGRSYCQQCRLVANQHLTQPCCWKTMNPFRGCVWCTHVILITKAQVDISPTI